MNGETGDSNTPVRRSSRARKPNSRFADDEFDGCIKKIVKGVSAPETPATSLGASPVRQKKGGKKKESGSEERGGGDVLLTEEKAKIIVSESVEKSLPSESNFSGSVNVTGKTCHIPDDNLDSDIQHDAVNGILNESEVSEIMGKVTSGNEKPQEKRTRGSAKKDDIKSLPQKEARRGVKRGGKVKSKTGDVEGIDESKNADETSGQSNTEEQSHLHHAIEEKTDAKDLDDDSPFQRLGKSIDDAAEDIESGTQLEYLNRENSSGKKNTVESAALLCESPVRKNLSKSQPQDEFLPSACPSSNISACGNVEIHESPSKPEVKSSPTKKTSIHAVDEKSMDTVGNQKRKYDVKAEVLHKENEILTEAAGSCSPVTVARSELNTKGVLRLTSPTRQKYNLNFSEAETSTPSQGRGNSNAVEGAGSPQRRRSQSSEGKCLEGSLPKEQEDSSETGMSVSSTEKLQKSPVGNIIKVIKKRVVGIKLVQRAVSDEKISGGEDKGLDKPTFDVSALPHRFERLDETKNRSKQVESSLSTSNESPILSQPAEHASIDCGIKDKLLSIGKRNRAESYHEGESHEQEVTKVKESPKAKKKRDDASEIDDVKQEAHKRKRQGETEDDCGIKRKKKDADFLEAAVQEIPLPAAQCSDEHSKITQALSSHSSNNSALSPLRDSGGEVENKLQKNVKSSPSVKDSSCNVNKNVDDTPDVEERRHSSVGNILNLLKRPDVAQKIVDNSESKSRWSDCRSVESSSRDDQKRRSVDADIGKRGERKQKMMEAENREKSVKWKAFDQGQSTSYKRDDRKQNDAEEALEKDKGNYETFHGSKQRRERKFSHGGPRIDSFKEESRISDEENASSSNSYKAGSTENDSSSNSYKAGSTENASSSNSYKAGSTENDSSCEWEAPSNSWSSFKDSSSLSRDNLINIPKKVLELGNAHKVFVEEENDDFEERRSSSIGNILSFLKRSGQSGLQPKQDESQSYSEGGKEEKISSLSERERSKRTAKDETFIPCSKREDGDQYPKSKKRGHYKSREGRVSRWSSREGSPDVPRSKWESVSKSSFSKIDDKSDWFDHRDSASHSNSSWDDVPQHPIQVLVSSNKGSSKHLLSGKEHNKFNTYGTWNKQNVGWKNWNENQTQRSYVDQKETLDSKHIAKRVIESDKYCEQLNVKVLGDDNEDCSNREGISEFIESIAGEIGQSERGSGEISPRSQQHGYPSDVGSESSWLPKHETSLSPNRDLSLSPQREPPLWSPRSSEIVLSPKSRELMSSLRNMEVKLTPQMQELVSQKSQYDSINFQEPGDYTVRDGDISSPKVKDGVDTFDIHSIPLPPAKGNEPVAKNTNVGSLYGKSEERKMFENLWESHDKHFGNSYSSKFESTDSETVEEKKPLKTEHLEAKESYEDDSHDKENLKPSLKNLDEQQMSEAEKLEYQSKKELDVLVKEEKSKQIVEERMRSFVQLRDNFYLGDRKKSKRSKEVRRMVCDCTLTKEEITRGEVGCGEDCLNRLLMIECGSRCSLKDRCTNKCFQNYDYADVEVFNADEKGCGIRARSNITAGSFIMEYVGEVFDSREFKRRRKEYAKNHSAHFYFMALKGDLFIDATRKGNISRFINHSCDPNAQTQKWTVNGELRVGFFAAKDIAVGEEINFDYRLERYGREPQRCFCGTSVCRGWLGESPDEKTKEEKEEERRLEKDKRRKEEKRSYLEDAVLEEEIEKLNTIKLKTRQDILNLCRLMVRADNFSSRVKLLQLVQSSTSACKRLFMDYHGLSVLWSWMADLGYAHEHASIKIEVLKTLECLPITNKTQLTDSRVLGVVERWSTQSFEMPAAGSPPPPPPPRPERLASGSGVADSDGGKKSSDTSEDSDAELDAKTISTTMDSSSVDDVSMDSVDVEQDALKSKPSLEGCMAEDDSSDSNLSDENKELKKRSAVEPGEGDGAATVASEDEATVQELQTLHSNMVELAVKLLEQWRNLKEYFRIPKKERIELMKEHEREVEEEIRGLDKDRKEKDKYRRDFDRRRRSPDREKDKDQRHSRRRSDRDSREDRSSDSPKMSKEQRRQLFEIQVQQEEEEAKQRKMQEEMWAMHVDRCRLLGQDPYLTPIFDPTCQYYWDPNTAAWQRYNGTDPNLPVPAAYGHLVNGGGDGSPMILSMPPGSAIATQPVAGHLAPDGEAATPIYDDPRIDLSTIPLPGEATQTSPTQPLPCQAVPVEGTPPQGARVLTFPVSGGEAGAVNPAVPINIGSGAVAIPFVVGEEAPPPPPPGPITIQLPPRWKMARDSEGHVYFYHIKSRTSQWEPPTLEQHQQLEANLGSESDSESSSSDSESTSTTDSEDFSSDEEEEEELEQVTTVERGELSEEKMIRRHRTKKPRSEALVQERVISPVLEIDKETARRERREAKERAQKEVRQERQEDRLVESTQDMIDLNDENEAHSEKPQKTSESGLERERHDHRESKMKSRDRTKSKERAANAIADNSDVARKCKENFRAKMATYIVSVLNPYRREDCKIGRITCNEDFKYLARKLTHFVMIKELKQLHSVEDLECNDSVKYKTKDFVRKYMSKYGHEFKRDPLDTKEY